MEEPGLGGAAEVSLGQAALVLDGLLPELGFGNTWVGSQGETQQVAAVDGFVIVGGEEPL